MIYNKYLILLIYLSLITPIMAENVISIWVRKNGSYSNGNHPGYKSKKQINLKLIKKIKRQFFDIQYNKLHEFKGFYLSQLLKKYRYHKKNNMALLHFSNGMIVPIALKRNTSYIHINQLFLATEILHNKKWVKKFPEIEKRDKVNFYRDRNPIKFNRIKIVPLIERSTLYFTDKNDSKVKKKFSPWFYVDTLKGIELVIEKSYYKQFEVTKNIKVLEGFRVYKERCQFCHGVRSIGAKFGWDYVDPIKVSEKRNTKNLHIFVKYPKINASKYGLQMPNQADLLPQETEYLWLWLDAVSKKRTLKYEL